MTTDITELAQSLKNAASKALIEEGLTWFSEEQLSHEDGIALHKADAEFIALANPANVLALVEALEKAQGMEAYWKTQCRGITDHCEELQARIAELEEAEQKLCAANVTLDARAELAERQLAERESRTVKLPPTFWYEHDDLSRDVPVLDKRLVKKMLREAGIKVEAE